MNHLSWDDAWEIAADDQVSVRSSVLHHLQECPACASMVQQAAELDAQLVRAFQLPQSLQQHDPENDALWHKVQARLADQRLPAVTASAAGRFGRRSGWLRWRAWVGSAAALVVVTVVAHRIWPSQGPAGQFVASNPRGASLLKSSPAATMHRYDGVQLASGALSQAPQKKQEPTTNAAMVPQTSSTVGSASRPLQIQIQVQSVLSRSSGTSVVAGAHVALLDEAGVNAGFTNLHGVVALSAVAATGNATPGPRLVTVVVTKAGYRTLLVYDVPTMDSSKPITVMLNAVATVAAKEADAWPIIIRFSNNSPVPGQRSP